MTDETREEEQSSPPLGVRGETLCFHCFATLTDDDHWSIGGTNYCMSCAAIVYGQ